MSHLPLEIQSSAFFWSSDTLFRYWWQDILENIGIIPSIYFLFLALIHFFSSGVKVSFWIGTQVKIINFKTNFLLFQENPPKMAIHPIIKICGQFKIPYSNLLTNQNKVFSLLTLIFTSRFRKMLPYCLATLEWKIKLLSFLNRHWVNNFIAAILIWLSIRSLIAVIKARVKK